MTRPSRILNAPSIGRALAEIAIIVVGVLIALGADAWWTDREEAELAEGYRAALLEDLVADSSLYDILVDRGWYQTQADGVDSLLVFLSDPDNERDPITLAQWLSTANRVGVGKKTSATFDDIRSSGRLALLDDPVLRRSLIRYHSFPIVLDQAAYEATIDVAIVRAARMFARLIGPKRLADIWACAQEVQDELGAPPLESPPLRSCLERRASFDGFDLASAVHGEPELVENLSVLFLMREVGLRGATLARDEAAELRAMLRGESE